RTVGPRPPGRARVWAAARSRTAHRRWRPGRIGCDRRRSLAGPGAASRPPPLPHHIEGGSRMSDPIRVLVADDHPAVLSGLVTLLDSAPDITVVAQAVDGTSALRAAQQHRPDVVLTDVRMPGATGIDI